MTTMTKNTVIKELKKVAREKSIRHKKWLMNRAKKMIECPNCGKSASTWIEFDDYLSPDENKKLEQIINLIKSNKDPYKKKLELFNLLKKLEVGEIEPSEERRTNILLQGKIYNELAKQSLRDYKKLTAEEFGKSKQAKSL